MIAATLPPLWVCRYAKVSTRSWRPVICQICARAHWLESAK